MMTPYERSDIIHIMKMNRLTLVEPDTVCLKFGGHIKDKHYQITILAAEGLPSVVIKQNGMVIVNETVKSIFYLNFIDIKIIV